MNKTLYLSAALLGATAAFAQQTPAPVVPPSTQEQHVNHLANETSPYLRQHMHNPVDWYPWGKEAIDRAKKEDKPIFLSIGYAACHWCHVMEHESFEDPAVAKVMNDNFVCIKVDREERPDLDEIYMAAVQAMTGQGGWPMSVWLTPDLKPFYGGTYFPPADGYGRPGFRRVLEHLAKLWHERRADALAGSNELTAHLQQVLSPEQKPGEPTAELVHGAVLAAREHYDDLFGGFAPGPQYAPKFPHASELAMLLRAAAAGDGQSLLMVGKSLDRMATGGMYDQLGGGFHRYSTDRQWLVPHFEKMLYDNAQLASLYLQAFQATGDEDRASVARATLDYMLREMQDQSGGFHSSQDADSEGVEGKFFVWQEGEFRTLLGDDADLAEVHWGVTKGGNWEEANVLTLARTAAQLAADKHVQLATMTASLERDRQTLFAAREKRVHPGTDDKVLTAWNGLAISAMAQGYQLLGDPRYLVAAQRAADFVLHNLVQDGRCFRSWRAGKRQHQGCLEDYAFLADGLLTLFESDFDPRWLAAAKTLLGEAIAHFRDPTDGNFFFTADDHEELLARTKTASESSTPSGVAVVAYALLRAGLLLGDEQLYDAGVGALRANHTWLEKIPAACSSLVLALQFHLGDPREVVIAGDPADKATQALLRAVRDAFPPYFVVAVVHAGNREALAALSSVFAGKVPQGGQPAAFVCRRGVCEKPVTDAAALAAALAPRRHQK
jgi:uncharacterized protein